MTEKPTCEEWARRIMTLEQKKSEGSEMKPTPCPCQGGQRPARESESGANTDMPDPQPGLDAIINAGEIQSILEDFSRLTHMTTAVLDIEGRVIGATGWQDICTRFHRVNPQTACNCTESDLFLAKTLKSGEYADYKCKNGLWDVVTPLYVGTRHMGNIYTGQFFYKDDPIDEAVFIKQAEAYGFDKDAYIKAFRQVPTHSRTTIGFLMRFLVKLTTYISKIGLVNVQLEKEIGERRQAEAALKDSEAHMRALVRAIPDLVWMKDRNGVYRFCNAKFESFFGANEKDIIGKTDYDFLDRDVADRFCRHDKLARAGGKPRRNEEEVVFVEDGHREHLETIKTPMYRSDGKFSGVLGIGRDITDRKRAEAAMRLNEARLETQLKLSQMTSVPLKKMIDFALEKAVELTGSQIGYLGFINKDETTLSIQSWSRNTIEACGIAGMQADYPIVRMGLWGEAIRQRKAVITNDYASTRLWKKGLPKGHPAVKRHMNVPVLDGDRIVALAGVGNKPTPYDESDVRQLTLLMQGMWIIVKRQRAEAERERLMSAIEQSSETIIISDPERVIRYVNPAFEKTSGYTREEIIGQSTDFLRSGEHRYDEVYEGLWKTISGGRTWRGHLAKKKKDGSSFTEDVTISPVVDASGAIINYVAVKRDITEELRIEREKARLEDQYHQARKVESIGRLAGGVAHDLNNLLTPILGYGEMLLDDFSPDDARKTAVEQIVRAGFRARDLVRQLLAFSRKQTLAYRSVDLNLAVTGFEKLLRRTIREDIEITILLSPDVNTIMADIGQIEQMIMNLSVNAADAMPDGGRLTIETAPVVLDEKYAATHQDAKAGEHVMLAVSDTGCGMDAATQERIFEPFFSTKGELGTGLGLATVYGIVKQHGGNIWVYSEVCRGTTFKIYLPVTDASPAEAKPAGKPPARAQGAGTILLVEDNQAVLNLGHAILSRQGYRVLLANSGDEALTLLASHDGPLDLLLTDVIMPGMNGKELFARAAEKYPGLKVLYMSGYTNSVIAHQGVLNEGVQFIQKPFTVQGLTTRVQEVLQD